MKANVKDSAHSTAACESKIWIEAGVPIRSGG